MNLCKDCHFSFDADDQGYGCYHESARGEPCPTDGSRTLTVAMAMRFEGRPCGPEGKFFKQRKPSRWRFWK